MRTLRAVTLLGTHLALELNVSACNGEILRPLEVEHQSREISRETLKGRCRLGIAAPGRNRIPT
jgi:hypothetical protein